MNNAKDIVNRRIAKFEKVSYEQFFKDMNDTFQLTDNSEKYVKDMYDNIKLPKRATAGSAGYDFFSPVSYFALKPGKTIKIPTGIRCEMNNDWVLMLFPRSSLGFKYQMGMCNTIPVVDSDYYDSDNEGHIFIKFVNRGNKIINITANDRIAQGIFLPFGITEDDDCENKRNGGFGSTGA